jgi:hypothetical protein
LVRWTVVVFPNTFIAAIARAELKKIALLRSGKSRERERHSIAPVPRHTGKTVENCHPISMIIVMQKRSSSPFEKACASAAHYPLRVQSTD